MYDTVQAVYTTASEMNFFYFDFFVKKKKGTSEESREKEVGFLLTVSRLSSPIILFDVHPSQGSGRFLDHQDEHHELFGCGTRKHLPRGRGLQHCQG